MGASSCSLARQSPGLRHYLSTCLDHNGLDRCLLGISAVECGDSSGPAPACWFCPLQLLAVLRELFQKGSAVRYQHDHHFAGPRYHRADSSRIPWKYRSCRHTQPTLSTHELCLFPHLFGWVSAEDPARKSDRVFTRKRLASERHYPDWFANRPNIRLPLPRGCCGTLPLRHCQQD